MKNFQEKRRYKQIMQSKPVLVFLGVIILVFAWSVLGLVGKMQETIKNKKIADDKIQELQKEKEKLLSDISELKTNKGVEENIREKFGLAKEGEGMVVIVDDKNPPVADKNINQKGFFSFLKNLFR